MTQPFHPSSLRRHSGFSLVEMIGVLAIIAILAVIIVPKVFATIASSRITSAVASVNAMKTTVTDFAGRYGTIPVSGVAAGRLDDLFVQLGLLDSHFVVKLGTQPTAATLPGATWLTANPWIPFSSPGANQVAQSRVVCVISVPAAVPGTGTNYRLDGIATNNLPAGARVVSAVITGLTAAESRELSLRIDGDQFSQPATGTADTRGRVTYLAAGTIAWIFLAQQ